MSTIRIKGDTSGHYDLQVPHVAGTNTVHLDKVPQTNSSATFDAGGTFTSIKAASTQYTDLELHDTTNDYAWILSNRGTSPGLLEVLTRDTNGTYTQPLKINASGAVQRPLQPGFHATNDSSVSGYTALSLSTSTQTVPWNVVRYNTGNHYNGSTHTFTVPIAGYYAINCQSRFDNITSYSRLFLSLNGDTSGWWDPGIHSISDSQGFNYYTHSVNGILYLNVNDTVKMLGVSNNGSGTVQGEGSFSMHMLG